MKKLILLLIPVLLLSGCRKAPDKNLSVSDQVLLEQMVDMEAFQEMKPQEQAQLLEALGLGAESPRHSLEDAAGQGRYMVVLSDTPGLNSFTLHYEDGSLARVATSFRKSAKDAPIATHFTGERLEEYHYKAIHFVAYPVTELAALLAQEGFAQVSVAPAE